MKQGLTKEEKRILYKKKIREGMNSGKAYKAVGHSMAKLKQLEIEIKKDRRKLQKLFKRKQEVRNE